MVKLIVAKALNNVIGKDNDLVWRLPADMRFFTETTKGHIVIMGRKNWESIPEKYRPLQERVNIVITRNEDFDDPECVIFHSVEEAIEKHQHSDKDIFIIGGAQIYKYTLDHDMVDEMLITVVEHEFDGDAFFPEFDESNWKKELILEHSKDEKNPYDFKVYRYYR